MASTLTKPTPSDPVRSLDHVRPTPAKAGLPSDRVGPTYRSVVKAAVIQHYGSVKEAAYQLGEGAGQPPLDPSLMMREFAEGKFGRFDASADDAAKATVASALHAAFGDTDPKARVQRLIRQSRQILDELQEAVNQ